MVALQVTGRLPPSPRSERQHAKQGFRDINDQVLALVQEKGLQTSTCTFNAQLTRSTIHPGSHNRK